MRVAMFRPMLVAGAAIGIGVFGGLIAAHWGEPRNVLLAMAIGMLLFLVWLGAWGDWS